LLLSVCLSICLFVCLSLRGITQKVVDEFLFLKNLEGWDT